MPRIVKLRNGNRVRLSDVRSIRVEEPTGCRKSWEVIIRHGDSFPPAESEINTFHGELPAREYADQIGELADTALIEEANRSAAGGDLCAVATIAAGLLAQPDSGWSPHDDTKFLASTAWKYFEAIKQNSKP